MTNKIETLTDAQRNQLKEFAQTRIAKALAIRDIDKPASEAALKRMYELAKMQMPTEMIWVDSPMAGAKLAVQKAREYEKRDTGKVSTAEKWHSWINGSWWAGFTSYAVACRDILGVDLGSSADNFKVVYEGLDELGFYWLNTNFCIASERPTKLKRDDEGRLHCEDGPAIEWKDGYALYSWHGTVVPKEWIENRKTLDPRIALDHPQIEQRRAAAEIIGWIKVLEQVNAKTIDKDPDPMIGELLEVDLPDSPGSRFLKVLCGTGRNFVVPVPSEMETALQANAWTYNVDPNIYRQMEVRT